MTAALLAAGLLRAAAAAGALANTWDASLRVEARTEYDRAGASAPRQTSALELAPRMATTLSERTVEATLAYYPRLTFQAGPAVYAPLPGDPAARGDQLSDGRRTDVVHSASAALAWHADANWRASLAGRATYGTQDFLRSATQAPTSSTPAGGTSGTPQPGPSGSTAYIPVPYPLPYQSYEVVAIADGRLGPRLRLRTRATGTYDGGASAEAEAQLLTQVGFRLFAAVDWDMTQIDVLATSLEVSRYEYSGQVAAPTAPVPGASDGLLACLDLEGNGFATTYGPTCPDRWEVWTVTMLESWRHRITRETLGWVSLGAALAGGGPPHAAVHGVQTSTHGLPAAEVGATHEPRLKDARVQGTGVLALTPQADQLSGSVVERAEARLNGSYYPAEHWALHAYLTSGVVVGGPQAGDRIATADTRIAWSPSAELELAVGIRAAVQKQPRYSELPHTLWNTYIALSLRDKGRL